MSINPATGKRRSGAAERKLREERAAADAARLAGTAPTAPVPECYRTLPPPPIEDTASLVTWGAQCLAVVMQDALQDESLPPQEKRRFLADCAAKLGMIRDKAMEQQQIKRLLREVRKERQSEGMTVIPLESRIAPRVVRRADDSFETVQASDPRHPRHGDYLEMMRREAEQPVVGGSQSLAGVQKPATARRGPQVERADQYQAPVIRRPDETH